MLEKLLWSRARTAYNILLTLQAPTPQNAQTHLNNLSVVAGKYKCYKCFIINSRVSATHK